MIIRDIKLENLASEARLSASMLWENNERDDATVYVDIPKKYGGYLSRNPNVFLLACAFPAFFYKEKRIRIEDEICPALKQGIETSLEWLRLWNPWTADRTFKIESSSIAQSSRFLRNDQAGIFFSGGVDAFSSLYLNRKTIPLSHNMSIRDGILVFGFEQNDLDKFRLLYNRYKKIELELGITIIPVYTNMSLLFRQNFGYLWKRFYQGAAFSAIAHALIERNSTMYISASHDISNITTYSTHPLLDPNYGGADLKIIHYGVEYKRFDKVKLVSEWDTALQNLRVCNKYMQYSTERFNCGRCRKCLLTMLELVAADSLVKSKSFPSHDIPIEILRNSFKIDSTDTESDLLNLIDPLTERNRMDLVNLINKKIREFRRRKKIGRIYSHIRNGIASMKNIVIPSVHSHKKRSHDATGVIPKKKLYHIPGWSSIGQARERNLLKRS
jgi:hypothetical protein